MDRVAIDLGGRESQIYIRQDINEVRLEKRLATIKLRGFFETLPPSRVIVETCAEAFAVAGYAKEAGHHVRFAQVALCEVVPDWGPSSSARRVSAGRVGLHLVRGLEARYVVDGPTNRTAVAGQVSIIGWSWVSTDG